MFKAREACGEQLVLFEAEGQTGRLWGRTPYGNRSLILKQIFFGAALIDSTRIRWEALIEDYLLVTDV